MDIFLLVLLFCLYIHLLFFVVTLVWRFCYFWMPIDLLLHFEEGLGELHPLAACYSTSQIQVNKATGKGGRQPCKTSSIGTNTINATQDTASDADNELKHPEECSSDNEDSMHTASVVECCSEVDKTQQLVVTVASVPQQFNTQMFSSVIPVPEQQLNVQVSPPVTVPKQSTSQVAPLSVREVSPPTAKEINLPTIQEIQDPCNTRSQDGCDDDSEPEDEEEEDRKFTVPHDNFSCDCQDLEEMMILQGALLCSSDTKLDQAGKVEETVTDEEGLTIMEGKSSFTSHVKSTKEANQPCNGEEIKNGNNNKESTSTVSSNSNSAYTQSADHAVDQQTQENDNGQTDMLPDHMSPND